MNRPESENHARVPKDIPLEVVNEIPNASGPSSQSSERHPSGGRAWCSSGVRFVLTLAIAAIADGLEVLFPPAWIPIDLATVGAFFLLWGFRWEIALVLIPEIIPGANVFPSWVLLALYLGNQGARNRQSS